MCPLTGKKQACLKDYYLASPAGTYPAKIYGKDPDTKGYVYLFFSGGCSGVDQTPNKTFFFDPDDYLEIKDALDGPGRVNFHGVPDSNHQINNAAWREVA